MHSRLAFITDPHIGRQGEETHGVDVRDNFRRILSKVQECDPEVLIIGGDLCFATGQAAIYQWVYQQLQQLPFPWYAISGNHDDTKLMVEAFGKPHALSGSHLYFSGQFASWPAFFLDSSTKVVSAEQLAWLQTQLKDIDRPVLLFLHHPPFISGVPYMDRKHSLDNRNELQKILFDFSSEVYVFCGHYHVERSVLKKNVAAFITPSCFFQINPLKESFEVDHYQIAYRVIDLYDNKLETTVRYL